MRFHCHFITCCFHKKRFRKTAKFIRLYTSLILTLSLSYMFHIKALASLQRASRSARSASPPTTIRQIGDPTSRFHGWCNLLKQYGWHWVISSIRQRNIASVILKLRIIVYEYLVHLWTSTCLWILKHFLQKVYVKSDKQKKRLVVLNFKKYFNNGPKQNCSKAQKN